MKRLHRLVQFLGIADEDHNIDLYNVAFACLVVKICCNPINWPGMTSLVPLIIAKMHRAHLDSKTPQQADPKE